MKRITMFTSFLLFITLCASVTYWVLQWMAPVTRTLVVPAQAERSLPAMSAAANLFGGTTEVVRAVPVQLKGIIRAARPQDSVAIISLEGKPPRALRVNAEVSSGIFIKEVNARGVVLSDHGIEREVRLPQFSAKPMVDGGNAGARNNTPADQTLPSANDVQGDGKGS